jgi:putative SOS response-associated peptidase YedK
LQAIADHFDALPDDDDWTPRYNVAPTQPVPIIRQHPKEPRREMSLVRWGLIPSWAKDASGSAEMINARSESAATRRARWENQTAILLRGQRRRAVCLRWTMGAMERPEWQLDQDLLYF